MKEIVHAGRGLLVDLAPTLVFMALFALTGDLVLSVVPGMMLALAQIGWRLLRRAPVDTLQWIGLVVLIASGSMSLVARDPFFVMLKPSLVYLLIGAAMLKPGWMQRYLPQDAMQNSPDLVITFGYAWAGVMFVSAAVNLVLALSLSFLAWGAAVTVWSVASKGGLFFLQFAVMKTGDRRLVLAGA